VAERGTPDKKSSQAPFIQALVQKSVTVITKLAGRLSFGMLGETRSIAQGGTAKKMVLRWLPKRSNQPRIYTDLVMSCLIGEYP
jgi:hypothetical protein